MEKEEKEEERLILKNIKRCKREIIDGKLFIGFDIVVVFGSIIYGIYAIIELIKGKSVVEYGTLFDNAFHAILMIACAGGIVLDYDHNSETIYQNELEMNALENDLRSLREKGI